MKQYNIEDLEEINLAVEWADGYIMVREQLTSNLTGEAVNVRMRYFVEKEAEG